MPGFMTIILFVVERARPLLKSLARRRLNCAATYRRAHDDSSRERKRRKQASGREGQAWASPALGARTLWPALSRPDSGVARRARARLGGDARGAVRRAPDDRFRLLSGKRELHRSLFRN